MTKGEPPKLDLVRGLADTFDVSLTAAAVAYMRICTEACAIVYSQENADFYGRDNAEFKALHTQDPRANMDADSTFS